MAIFRYCVSFSELVVTLMPSCTGVVQAGKRRPTPETSTIQRRQAPTDEMPSSQQSVGMYLPPARATSRMVCPSRAGTYSPSIRMEMFSGKWIPPSHTGQEYVVPQMVGQALPPAHSKCREGWQGRAAAPPENKKFGPS